MQMTSLKTNPYAPMSPRPVPNTKNTDKEESNLTRQVCSPKMDDLVMQCLKEFVLSAFLQFAGAVASTDPNTDNTTQITNFAISYSFITFAAQVAAYGVMGNPGLTLIHMILQKDAACDMLASFAVIIMQLSGGCAAMGFLVALRGVDAVSAYIPVGSTGWAGCLALDGCFSFLLGYIHLKLVWTYPKGSGPIVNSPYSPLVTAAFTYVALVSLAPFTGAGINIVRSLAPMVVVWFVPYNTVYSVLGSIGGQLIGYSACALAFLGVYSTTGCLRVRKRESN